MKTSENNWFSHEANTHTIPEMWAMRAKYGSEGYGNYFILLEILRLTEDYQIDISKPYTYGMLSGTMGIPVDKIKAWIHDCIHEFEILQTDGTHIWSDDLRGRMEYMEEKKATLRERGRKGGLAKKTKKQAQVNLDESTSSDNVNVEKAHNNTLQTEQNITDTTSTTNNTTISNSIEAEEIVSNNIFIAKDWNTLKQRALNDTKFLSPYTSSGKLYKETLADWLTAFNSILEFQATPMKSEHDYRKHFANWFKFRDPKKEKPHSYLPMPVNKASILPEKPISFMKNPAEVLAEQARARQEREERLLREDAEREAQLKCAS